MWHCHLLGISTVLEDHPLWDITGDISWGAREEVKGEMGREEEAKRKKDEDEKTDETRWEKRQREDEEKTGDENEEE